MTALFISIFLLTIGDAFCSALAVTKGWMTEGNALLHGAVMEHPVLSCTLIAIAVGVILIFIWRVRHKAKWLPYALSVVLVVKIGIMGLHAVGIYQILNS